MEQLPKKSALGLSPEEQAAYDHEVMGAFGEVESSIDVIDNILATHGLRASQTE